MNTFKEYVDDLAVPKAFEFHIENSIPIAQNVFRPHSDNYYKLFSYAREHADMLENASEFDLFLLESDIGCFGVYDEETVPLDHPFVYEDKDSDVELNKPKRGGKKKYYVYVRNEKGNIIKVEFGDTSGLTAKIGDPAARKSFAARHNCDEKKDKTKPGYWACNLPKYAKELGLKDGGNFYW